MISSKYQRGQIPNLRSGAHIHLMGICGTAMGSLAGLLKEQGYKVTGSDQNVYPPMSTQLEKLGISIFKGYKKENLEPKPDFVVVGNVISAHFEEAQALLHSDIPYTSLPEAMGKWVISNRSSWVIAGTHGKTTTTSMASWVGEVCGFQPGFLIGGVPLNFPLSFRNPRLSDKPDEFFIIEGDEYDTAFFDKVPKFIHYKPKYVILTSIEFDHADIYNSIDDILKAFKSLLELIPEDGFLIYNAEDENIKKILPYCRAKKMSYGLEKGDFTVQERVSLLGRNQFSVRDHISQTSYDMALKVFGPHNTLNAISVLAMTRALDWSLNSSLQALADFKGVKRRQEVIIEKNGVTVVEDFAHHPTAVSLTLDCMREQYPGRRVIALYEPRSATSRRNVFEEEYVKAFMKADITILPQAFDLEKIKESDRFSSERVINKIRDLGSKAIYTTSHEDILSKLKLELKSGDVLIIMSNGGFGGIYSKILELVSNQNLRNNSRVTPE